MGQRIAPVVTLERRDACVKPARGQSPQQEPDCCIGGHLWVPYEQYTQQSPGFGLSIALQCSHS